MLIASTA